MADNKTDSISAPSDFAVIDQFDGALETEAEALKSEALRSVVARLQRRAHEMYVECNYRFETDALPSSFYRRINQLKDDADILLMLVDGANNSDGSRL